MSKLRVLVVDDEPLALERLSTLLERCADVELVGELRSGGEALDRIHVLRPDLLLLDIDMPRFDGLDVVEALLRRDWPEDRPVPLVSFVTAHPQFASAAFESGVLDFLCKPVRLARLEKTIERARLALEQRETASRLKELSDRLGELRRTRSDDRSLWVHQRGGGVRLDIGSLDWLQAEGEYVRLHVGERSYLTRSPITTLAAELAGFGFVRIHRSVVVNQERLRAIRRMRSGAVTAVLSNSVELPVGRKFRQQIYALTRTGSARP